MLDAYSLAAPSPARIVHLPCGHEESFPSDGSMTALSISVLRHLASCRDERGSLEVPGPFEPVPADWGVIEPQGRTEFGNPRGGDLV